MARRRPGARRAVSSSRCCPPPPRGSPGRWRTTSGSMGSATWRVAVDYGDAPRSTDGANGGRPTSASRPTSRGLAAMAAGASPLRLIVSGKLRIRGKRRRARKLRAMANGDDPTWRTWSRAGGDVDPDAALPRAAVPDRPGVDARPPLRRRATRSAARPWYVEVRDGEPLKVTTPPTGAQPDATSASRPTTYRGWSAGELSPDAGDARQLTLDRGKTLPGHAARPLDRPLAGPRRRGARREEQQREVQARRAGSWGSA